MSSDGPPPDSAGHEVPGIVASVQRVVQAVETSLLVLLLGVMVAVAVYQVLARNLFGGGLVWGTALVQVAMLWMTMVGASVAVGGSRHIKIDIVNRFAGARLQAFAARSTALFAAVLCAALGWHSIDFIRWDYIDGVLAFAGVPAWLCESIIPVAAFWMALRFVLQAIWPPAATDADGGEDVQA